MTQILNLEKKKDKKKSYVILKINRVQSLLKEAPWNVTERNQFRVKRERRLIKRDSIGGNRHYGEGGKKWK